MTPKLDSCQIRGTVIEAIEMGGESVLRVSITGGSLDFLSDPESRFHLGDVLLIEGEFRVRSARPALDPEDHHSIADADFLA